MAADDFDGGRPGGLTDYDLEELSAMQQRAAEEFPFTLKLSGAPVQAHGEMIDSITLQLPNGNDLFHSGGDPFVAGAGRPADLKRLFTLISRIAQVPESTVRQLSVPDLKTIEGLLLPLFQPSAAKLKHVFSTSPNSTGTSRRL